MKKANAALCGKNMQVIVDYIEDGIATARGASDAPDIDNVVFVDTGRSKVQQGDIINVEITGENDCNLLAIIKKRKQK